MASRRPRVLFICSRNQWRSPTAAQIYATDDRIDVRSAGLASSSRHQISDADLAWADLVLVMEDRHKAQLRAMFQGQALPSIKCLDIPDDYRFMDAELVELIIEATEALIAELLAADDSPEPGSQ